MGDTLNTVRNKNDNDILYSKTRKDHIDNYHKSHNQNIEMSRIMIQHRVGSRVVLAWIYCTEKLLFHNDVLSESKYRFLPVFSHLYPECYTPFSSPHFFQSNDARYILIKLLAWSTDSVTKF